MFRRLMPREMNFFNYFEKHSQLMIEGCEEFLAMVSDSQNMAKHAARIRELENATDDVAHECIDALRKTFITPFDRNEIHHLTSRMDDILDAMEAAAERLWLYEIKKATPEAIQLAKNLVDAASQLTLAIKGLREVKRDRDKVMAACVEINRLENANDEMLREGLARLFREEKDPVLIMKWKEVYEILEDATDRCEDATDVIEGVVLENE